MPSARVKDGQTDRAAEADESRLMVYVAVSQTTGTYARFEEVHHHGCTDEERIQLAKIRTDATENSRETLIEVVGRLLEMHALRVIRARQLEIDAY